MIVHFILPSGELLLTRHQEGRPHHQDRLPVTLRDERVVYYRIACIETPLEQPPDGQRYYSLTDAPQEVYRVLLKEE